MSLLNLHERFAWRNEYLIALLPVLFLFSRAAADALVAMIGLAFIYRSYRMGGWSWARKPWFVTALGLWVGLMVGVSPLAIDPVMSWVHSFGFIRWPLFAAAMAYWLLADLGKRAIFEWAVVALVAFIMADTALQYFTGVDIFGHQIAADAVRLTGPFHKPMPGTYTLRIFFIALAAVYFSGRILSERARLLTVLSVLAVGAGFIFITGERGAFLSLMLGSGVVVVGLFWVLKSQRLLMSAAVGVLVLTVGVFAMTQERMVQRTLVSTVDYIKDWPDSPSGHSVLPALEIWKIRGSAFFGLGIKTYKTECEKAEYDAVEKPFMTPRWCQHPHNIYVEWLVSAGWFGLFGFLLMLALIIRELFINMGDPVSRLMPFFALATLLTTFWPLMGSMSFFSNGIAAIIWMTVGWALARTGPLQRMPE